MCMKPLNACDSLANWPPYTRRWAATEAAGVPLNSTLSGLRQGASDAVEQRLDYLERLLQNGSLDVQSGGGGFTPVEVAFINVGRASGSLDSALGCLADLYESDHRTVLRARRKMTYPLLVAFCGCWIPTLPVAFFVGPWLWLTLGLLSSAAVFWLGGIFLWQYFTRLRGRPRWAQSRFFWALATALEAGILIDEALALASEATSPSTLSASLRYLTSNGRDLTELLRNTGLFDEAVLNMLQTGEVSGRLPESLRQAARYLEAGTL